MLRQLLTLLAVFAGLTAAVEPARALEAGVATVQLAERQSACTEQSVGTSVQLAQASSLMDRQAPCPRPVVVIHTPTVMLKADRARE